MNNTITMNKSVTKNKDFIPLRYLKIDDYDLLQELLRFESVSGRERKAALFIKSKLIDLNFQVFSDSIGNVWGVRGDAEKYSMLNAHMDNKDIEDIFRGIHNINRSSDYKEQYGSYNSLLLDEYESYLSKEIEAIKAKKVSEQNNVSINIDDLSDEEAISVWEEDLLEIKNLYGEDFKAIGFKCANCVNSCKAFKLCYYFQPNADINTKKIYLKNKKEQETLSTNNKKEDADFIQESFDLDGKIIKLNKVNNGANSKIKNSNLKNQKYTIKVDLINDKISGSGKKRVLGGDDKCGIFIALKVAELLPDMPMKILFTVQEETGCKGAKFFVKNNAKWLDDVKYSITIDRRDSCHLLWSQRGVRSCSDNFAAEIMYQGIRAGVPVKLEDGGSADVVVLRDFVPNAVNISAGYYKAHTVNEYIVPSEVDKIVGWVKNIIQYV